jgi:hypothetical protein
MFNRKKQPLMTWMTNMPGLAEDPLCQPQYSNKFIPPEWRNMPQYSEDPIETLSIRRTRTAKKCPSFIEWFSMGVILPAWCDIAFKYNKEQDLWQIATGDSQSPYRIEIHSNPQMLNYMDYKHRGSKAQLIFKLNSPWYMKTPKGYSTLQLPLFYHSDRDWTVAAGTWHSDTLFDTSIQIFYFGDGDEVFIKKGQPLAQYLPYKRTKINFLSRQMTEKDIYTINAKELKLHSKGTGGYAALEKD